MLVGASARSSVFASQQRDHLVVFGFNKDGLLGIPDKIVARPTAVPFELAFKVTKLSCGFKHVAFLAESADGVRVFASGSNKRG